MTRPYLWRAFLPLALLAVLLLALFHRLFLGEVLFWGLPALQFYPWREFAVSELRAGRLPLWNPYNGAGAPLLANYQSAVFYPPNLLHLLIDGPQLMGILAVLHLAWAGVGMWMLGGRWQVAPLGRAIMTLAFPLSTTLVGRLGTLPMIHAAAWLPWLILCADSLVTRPGLRPFLALSASTAMILLTGHAQWAFYSLLLTGLYALWRARAEIQRVGQLVRPLVVAGLAVALGTGIAAIQILPTAALQRVSQRSGGVDEAFALNFSLSPVALVTLFNADFFGNPGDGTYIIGGAAFEIAGYTGVLTITLALLISLHYLRRRFRPALPGHIGFFAATALVSLVLAFGQFTPIYPFLYRSVPTFNLFQAPSRWLLLTAFSVAILAGFAVQHWQPSRRAQRPIRLVTAGALGMAAVGLLGARLLPDLPPIALSLAQGIAGLGVLLFITARLFAMQPPDTARRANWGALVLLFLCLDLWWANARSNPTTSADFYAPLPATSPTTAQERTFQSAAEIDALMFDTFLPFNDYRAAAQQREAYRRSGLPNLNLLDRQSSLNNFDPLRPAWYEALIDALNRDTETPETAGLRRIATLSDGQPRVWISAGESSDSVAGSSATIIAETPARIEIAVTVGPGGDRLNLADMYYPDWRATVDGQPAEVLRVFGAFRGVTLTAGEHTVIFEYMPQTVMLGALISGLAVLVWLAVAVVGQALERRQAPPPSDTLSP